MAIGAADSPRLLLELREAIRAQRRAHGLLRACEEQLAVLDAIDPSTPEAGSTFLDTFDPVVDGLETTDYEDLSSLDRIFQNWAETFAMCEWMLEQERFRGDEREGFLRGFIARARGLLLALYCKLGGKDLDAATVGAALTAPHPRTLMVLKQWGRGPPSVSSPRARARPRAHRPAAKRALGARSGQDPGEGDDDPEGEPAGSSSPLAGVSPKPAPPLAADDRPPAGGLLRRFDRRSRR